MTSSSEPRPEPTPSTARASIPRIGDTAPDFRAVTTEGELQFSSWQGDGWVVLFSHPADFTPVCTTELAELARRSEEFTRRGVKLIGLSIDSIHAHLAWRENIREKLGVEIGFPLIADLDARVANLYGLIHPGESTTATVRAVFLIDPKRVVRALVYYPLNIGRNIHELIRVVDAVQTTDRAGVATPVDWQPGDDVVVPPPRTVADVAARKKADYQHIDFYLAKKPLAQQAAAGKRP